MPLTRREFLKNTGVALLGGAVLRGMPAVEPEPLLQQGGLSTRGLGPMIDLMERYSGEVVIPWTVTMRPELWRALQEDGFPWEVVTDENIPELENPDGTFTSNIYVTPSPILEGQNWEGLACNC